ncbi:MAG: class I tRNA ligase family protein [Patescibacteria group bacterium]
MDLPIETRRLIYGIVRNPKDNTYLCLDWPDQSWGSFVVGGIEDTEGPVDAAEREILEETGFKNLKFVSEVEWQVHTKFFAPHKNENRYGIAVGVVFDLLDQRQDPVSEEEKKKHTVRWISKSKVRDFVTHRNAKFIWDNYLHPSAFSGDGVMVNSGKADGMDSVKFKEVIVDKLDALTCKDKKTCLIVHGIGGHDQENWFPWLKKELVKNCWEALVPSMPETDHPSLGLWNDFLKKKSIQINEQSVLVGHSLGAPAVLNYLQLTGTKVDTVILVAPTNPLQHWESLKKDFAQADWDAVKKMSDEKNFNWKKIQRLAKRFIIIHSDNDPFVPVESISFYKERLPSAEVYLFSGKKHFSKSNGDMTSFPEILKFFPMQSAGASRTVNYKLRDWLFSRQRYWGEPIPIIHCEKCGNVPVPEEDLPLELPKVKKYEPTGTGESPLASIDKWVNTKCPQCGNKAKRETNTMPQWAGSNWYFLRYCDPKNEKLLADPEKLKQWLPVDLYVGGAEHAVLHLLYARFMYKFLYDIGTVPKECGDEPFTKLKNQGLILGQDNQKMSKSRGNVVNPDDVIKEYGADAMRMYEMFMGPFEDAKPWNTNGIVGMSRFLERIWQWGNTIVSLLAKGDQRVLVQNEGRKRILHQTIQKVTEDIENFRFNTAISQLMIYFKEVTVQGKVLAAEFLMTKEEFEIFLKLLSPFAPHLVAELWEKLGHQDMVDFEPWPVAEASHLQVSEISVAVQINGRVRDQLTVPAEASEEAVLKLALASDKVQKWLGGKKPKMAKYIKGRIITIAV